MRRYVSVSERGLKRCVCVCVCVYLMCLYAWRDVREKVRERERICVCARMLRRSLDARNIDERTFSRSAHLHAHDTCAHVDNIHEQRDDPHVFHAQHAFISYAHSCTAFMNADSFRRFVHFSCTTHIS
jgi:hypothetical protein